MFVATISLIDCLIGVYTDFNSISDFHSYHNDTLHYSWVFWVSPVLGWGSEVSCPRTLSREKKKKKKKDPVQLEHRTPRLRVKIFTTEPGRTPGNNIKLS